MKVNTGHYMTQTYSLGRAAALFQELRSMEWASGHALLWPVQHACDSRSGTYHETATLSGLQHASSFTIVLPTGTTVCTLDSLPNKMYIYKTHRIDGQYIYKRGVNNYYPMRAERVCVYKKSNLARSTIFAAISDDQQLSAAQISVYVAIINCFLWFTLRYWPMDYGVHEEMWAKAWMIRP